MRCWTALALQNRGQIRAESDAVGPVGAGRGALRRTLVGRVDEQGGRASATIRFDRRRRVVWGLADEEGGFFLGGRTVLGGPTRLVFRSSEKADGRHHQHGEE